MPAASEKSGSSEPARATGVAPFRASMRSTASPIRFDRDTSKALSAPILPLPSRRKSFPLDFFISRNAVGIEPNRYAAQKPEKKADNSFMTGRIHGVMVEERRQEKGVRRKKTGAG